MKDTTKLKASQHESYNTFTIIAVLLPLIGLILGIVYLTKDDKLDRKLGEHLIAFSILFAIIWSVGYSVLIAMQTQTTVNPYANYQY